jgi:hypothetical protein
MNKTVVNKMQTCCFSLSDFCGFSSASSSLGFSEIGVASYVQILRYIDVTNISYFRIVCQMFLTLFFSLTGDDFTSPFRAFPFSGVFS